MENLIEALNKLQENADYCRQHFEYKTIMQNRYSAFFAAKTAGKPYSEAAKVFETLPQPQNDAERVSKEEVLKTLNY